MNTIKEQLKIIICRHAESIEDVDNSIYDTIPDLKIPLTELGIQQAITFSKTLDDILKDRKELSIYSSPGVRNIETVDYIIKGISKDIKVENHIEPLLVKQDWGNINSTNRSKIESDRYNIGVLRYDFPTGEKIQSMVSRMKEFLEKIKQVQKNKNVDILILSHGFEFRILLMLMLNWTESEFESYSNLKNCEHRILTNIKNKYFLNRPLKKHGLPITRKKNG